MDVGVEQVAANGRLSAFKFVSHPHLRTIVRSAFRSAFRFVSGRFQAVAEGCGKIAGVCYLSQLFVPRVPDSRVAFLLLLWCEALSTESSGAFISSSMNDAE